MARPKRNEENKTANETPNQFRFNLTGLISFSVALVAVTAVVVCSLRAPNPKPYSFIANNIPDPDQQDKTTFVRKGAWGELLTSNVKMERPVEYVAGEVRDIQPMTWTFAGSTPAQVKDLFVAGGLTAKAADDALASGNVSTQGNQTVFKPADNFILSLNPETRQKLYTSFYGKGVYSYFDYPYIFPKDTVESIYTDPRLHPDDVAMLKKLVFISGDAVHLVDYPVLLQKIPTFERRVAMTRALSHQSAVLARLCIRPDSDIDKIAGYWGHMVNVHFTNIRPLLESLKELPNGGTVSLAYLLPPFARERLYTYPLPPEKGDPIMDCHWSTFNFANRQPDNRYNDATYTVQYLQANFYAIDVPNVYGDIILFMNDKKEIKHSAVFIADDLAFTKYGNNHTQPWMFVRISDMQEHYPTLKVFYMRRKTD